MTPSAKRERDGDRRKHGSKPSEKQWTIPLGGPQTSSRQSQAQVLCRRLTNLEDWFNERRLWNSIIAKKPTGWKYEDFESSTLVSCQRKSIGNNMISVAIHHGWHDISFRHCMTASCLHSNQTVSAITHKRLLFVNGNTLKKHKIKVKTMKFAISAI